jgi:hypothetical protein
VGGWPEGTGGLRGLGRGDGSLRRLGCWPFPVPRTPRRTPKTQCWHRSARGFAAQRISAFSTGLTRRRSMAKVGGCANGLRIACGAGPLGGYRHHSLVTPIDWKHRTGGQHQAEHGKGRPAAGSPLDARANSPGPTSASALGRLVRASALSLDYERRIRHHRQSHPTAVLRNGRHLIA